MQITLTQTELEKAVKAYMEQMLVIAQGKHFAIDFQTTRSPSGCIALIEITDDKKVDTPPFKEEEEEKKEEIPTVKVLKAIPKEKPEETTAEPEKKKSFFSTVN